MSPHDELDLLSSYLDGELDAGERARLDAHMTSCAECRSTIAGLKATIADLRTLPEPAPTPQDSWALRAAIRRARSPMRRWQKVSWAAGAVAAAAITFAAVTLPGGGGAARTFQATSDQNEAGVPVLQSGENLTAAQAQNRLLELAGVRGPVELTQEQVTGGSPESFAKDSAGAGRAVGSPNTALLYAGGAVPDRDRAGIDRCVGVVRRSTQQFLEPLQFVVATFEGKPAYLLFFRSAERYELWVVERFDCNVLFFSQAGG